MLPRLLRIRLAKHGELHDPAWVMVRPAGKGEPHVAAPDRLDVVELHRVVDVRLASLAP